MNGKALHFYLAGINNQNFLMRDQETGTWWQQITGKAIYGPLRGAVLELVLSDELSFGEWKSEFAGGQVLAPVHKYDKEYDSKWEPEVAKYPVVISFPGTELKSRDVVVGLEMPGASRAYPWDSLVKQSPVLDSVNGLPLLIAVGPDGKSFRVFVRRIDGNDAEFFLKAPDPAPATDNPAVTGKTGSPAESRAAISASSSAVASSSGDPKPQLVAANTGGAPAASSTAAAAAASSSPASSLAASSSAVPAPWLLLDTSTGSEWNFQGCAVSGPSMGKCLDRVPALKDYWFDWRNYHRDTTIYKR